MLLPGRVDEDNIIGGDADDLGARRGQGVVQPDDGLLRNVGITSNLDHFGLRNKRRPRKPHRPRSPNRGGTPRDGRVSRQVVEVAAQTFTINVEAASNEVEIGARSAQKRTQRSRSSTDIE